MSLFPSFIPFPFLSPFFLLSLTKRKQKKPVTVTEKPDQFYLSTATTTQGIQATIIEDCKLDGTKSASCEVSIAYSYNGQATATSTATVLGGDGSNYRHAVSVTAGADKLAKATGEACSAASSLMMNTRAVVMWGLLGAFGVLALQG
ncbi:hypothetical protein GGS20DRAFT_569351 [Poronia punctata]|nr:hypothetical protein GGS20DRAFT_569351 [Poronia punctata]